MTTLRKMVEDRRVYVDGRMAKAIKQTIMSGQQVELRQQGMQTTTKIGENLKIVYQDADIIIVDKPAGLLTATDPKEKRPTALKLLNDRVSRINNKTRVLLIHRLDRDASGLLVFARNDKAYDDLKQQFFEHSITRKYDVIVHGKPRTETGMLKHNLIEDEHGRVHITRDEKQGKIAILDFEVIRTVGDTSHLKCTLHTGRKHQIRVQLKAMRMAVLGDPVYGTADEFPNRLALHASLLVFKHPRTKAEMKFESPMPRSFAAALTQK